MSRRPNEGSVSINKRDPIIDDVLHRYPVRGELEELRDWLAHQETVLRAILAGCSNKDFRHTLQHLSYKLEESDERFN